MMNVVLNVMNSVLKMMNVVLNMMNSVLKTMNSVLNMMNSVLKTMNSVLKMLNFINIGDPCGQNPDDLVMVTKVARKILLGYHPQADVWICPQVH